MHPTPFWTTASFGDAADTSALELRALALHMQRCGAANGRLFKLRCAAEWAHGLVAPRMVTTLVVLGLVTTVACLFL